MTLLGKEAIRLLRAKWKGPVPLAEELYAILQSQEPVDMGPIAVDGTGNPGTPAVAITSPIGSVPLQIHVPGVGDFTFTVGPDGGLVLTGPSFTTPAPGPPSTPSGGGGVPGQIQSGGPGAGPYVVKIYPNGLANPSSNVNVTQLDIDSGETIPVNTWTLVTQTGGGSSGFALKYWMQVPMWGPDL